MQAMPVDLRLTPMLLRDAAGCGVRVWDCYLRRVLLANIFDTADGVAPLASIGRSYSELSCGNDQFKVNNRARFKPVEAILTAPASDIAVRCGVKALKRNPNVWMEDA